MHGVVSLLDAQHDALVEDLWGEFKARFGVHGVHKTPFPHFSYHVAEHYDLDQLTTVLNNFASHMSKFHVKTTGLGLFTGTKPVLYIPVVRSPQLTELHREFWPEICKTASGVLNYYAPNMWMPHITIAQGDIDHSRLPDVIRLLGERDFTWDITVDNLAVIHDSGVKQTVKFRFDFG